MTVEKGSAWGEAGPLPADGVLVSTDAEARAVVEEARRAGGAPPPLGLVGGDLCRTLGGRGDRDRLRSRQAVRVPLDLGVALLDGRRFVFVAHLVARRSWWWGPVVAVMNAQYIGPWDVAPRAHPGDGRLDVLDVSAAFGLGDRLRARRRLPSGTHVPHPGIARQHTTAWSTDLGRPTPIWLDGERVTTARHVAVRVEPEALRGVV